MEREKPWLSKNSKAHDKLQEIVLKKRFLNTIPYYIHFRYVRYGVALVVYSGRIFRDLKQYQTEFVNQGPSSGSRDVEFCWYSVR